MSFNHQIGHVAAQKQQSSNSDCWYFNFWRWVFAPIRSVCCLVRTDRLTREQRISNNVRRIGLASTRWAARQAC